MGLLRWLSGKESTCNAGDMGVPSLDWEDPLEKKMTTHSSILDWETPQTEEPGGLQSMGLQRVRHNLATQQQKGFYYVPNWEIQQKQDRVSWNSWSSPLTNTKSSDRYEEETKTRT